MSNDYELPPLDGHKECTGDLLWHALNYRGATHDQAQAAYEALQNHVREYALLAVQRERDRIARLVAAQTHTVAEFLYGHTREMAVEWAKGDKYDSNADKADDILAIVVAAIRAQP
jgi:hypothetical protein